MLCLYSSDTQEFHTIVGLGSNVCGHPKIVHGGEKVISHLSEMRSMYPLPSFHKKDSVMEGFQGTHLLLSS